MKWAVVYHKPSTSLDAWSTPEGFINALEQHGTEIIRLSFKDPSAVDLPNPHDLISATIDAVLIFYAGKSESLEQWLLQLRLAIEASAARTSIISELGDEPQTRHLNALRVQLSDLSFTPDAECCEFWNSLGANCHWLTHWADSEYFYLDRSIIRKRIVVTTMGQRKYSLFLRLLLGKFFQNRNCANQENTWLYNSGLIAFQYARWGEITRRIFEAGACGCCVFTNQLSQSKRLDRIFRDKETIIYYRNAVDLILQLVFYLTIGSARARRIGDNAARLIEEDHSTSARAQQLIEAVSLLG
jgi:hypothetical protein